MKPRGPSKERVGERELSSQQCLKGSLSIKAKTRQTKSRSTVWRRGEPGVEDAGQWKGHGSRHVVASWVLQNLAFLRSTLPPVLRQWE